MKSARPSPLILVVEDDPTTNRTLQGILAGAGFRTVVAGTLAEATERMREGQPDLMLLDVNLPDGSGFDFCGRIMERSGSFRLPVLFISANQGLDSKIRGFEAGGVDYISKPLAGAEILARVGTHLRLKRAYEALSEIQVERMHRLASVQRTAMPMPEDLPEARFQAAVRQRLQAGGDFYDVIISGEGSVDYLVADASGHDLGASFWTAALKALVGEHASPLNSPSEILHALNSALGRVLPSGAFFTLIYARLNRRRGRLQLANAGHPPAIVVTAGAEKVLVIEQEGDVIGPFTDPVFGVAEVPFKAGDRLFLYSDGVVENGGPLKAGVCDLVEACRSGRSESLDSLVPMVLDRVTRSRGATDDMVLLGVEG